MTRNALNWFEIPVRDIDRAQAFYERLLGRPMRREPMGPQTLAVFAYDEGGAGGALLAGPEVAPPSQAGTLVYLDVADLQAQGVPIDGEAGVGYRLQAGLDLPPLMFTAAEAQALVAAVRLAQPRLDRALAAAAEDALGKILCVLPAAERAAAESLAVYAAPFDADEATRDRLGLLRQATARRRRVVFDYVDAAGSRSPVRLVRPLGCFHWDATWTLAAWCERRADFRNFRLDRMHGLADTGEVFRDEPGRTLPDFLRAMRDRGD